MVLKIRKYKSTDKDFLLGEKSNTVIDRVCAILLALTPLFQHYVGLFRNAGFTVLLLVFPFIFFRSIINIIHREINNRCILAVLPIIIYEVYTIIAHSLGVNSSLYGLFMAFIFMAISVGAVNSRVFFRTSLFVCKLATLCIVIQYLSYYLLHRHIQMVPVRLLLPGSDIWITRAIAGVSRAGELYRPSSFFLEPSHLFLYSFPILCFLLLFSEPNSDRIKDAVIVSLGMLLSTSGFSVVTVALFWAIYFILYRNKKSADVNILRLLSFRTIIVLVIMIITVIVASYSVPVFRDTISRIFNIDARTSVAISGRIRLANEYIRTLQGKSLIFGVSERVEDFKFHMAGFHSTLYKWGIVGVFLTYWFYGQGLLKLRGAYFYITLIIIVVSFFSAHTHGTFYMMYYCVLLMNGYYTRGSKESTFEYSKYRVPKMEYD